MFNVASMLFRNRSLRPRFGWIYGGIFEFSAVNFRQVQALLAGDLVVVWVESAPAALGLSASDLMEVVVVNTLPRATRRGVEIGIHHAICFCIGGE